MRHTPHIAMAVLLALSLGGCGELENEPFRTGTVHGRLTESDPEVALVSVLGSPGLLSNVARDGQFTLERVPAGQAELFIVASANRALRVELTVPGGQSLSLGELVPVEASFLSLRVRAPAKQSVDTARVSLVGTPLQQLPLDEDGRLDVGPIPDGCHTLSVSLQGFPEVRSEACVSAGEFKEVKVNLPAPDGGKGYLGCAETGCEEDLRCAPDGRCVECVEDTHCGPGLSCNGFRCEGEGAVCTPCDGNWKCGAGASCQHLPEGGTACVERCEDSDDCEHGLTCQADQCLPDPARFQGGCQAYRQLGMACDGDARCRDLGLVNGLCLAGACTYPCTSDRECPDSFSCRASPAGSVCQPRE
jgi:hypothetical protein